MLWIMGYGFAELDSEGGIGYGELWLHQEYASPEPETPLVTAEGLSALMIMQAYSFGPYAYPPAEGYGEVMLFGFGYETDSYGMANLELGGFGWHGYTYDTEGTAELFEELVFATEEVAQEVLSVRALFTATTLTTTQATFLHTVYEALLIDEYLQPVLEQALADTVALADVITGNTIVTQAVLDALQIASPLQPTLSLLGTLAEAVVLADALRSVVDDELADEAQFVDTLEVRSQEAVELVSEAVIDAAVQGIAVLTVIVEDDFEVDETLTSSAVMTAAIAEGLRLGISLTIDGVPYLGLSLNTGSRGMSEYDNFEFDSLAMFGGQMYGINADGLYRFGGSTDAGAEISAYVRTALLRLGDGREARVDSAYLGFNGTLQLKVTYIDARGVKRGYVYDLQELPATDMRPGRIKVGKGLKSVYWAFELSNMDGAEFDLDKLEVLPLVLNRRLI